MDTWSFYFCVQFSKTVKLNKYMHFFNLIRKFRLQNYIYKSGIHVFMSWHKFIITGNSGITVTESILENLYRLQYFLPCFFCCCCFNQYPPIPSYIHPQPSLSSFILLLYSITTNYRGEQQSFVLLRETQSSQRSQHYTFIVASGVDLMFFSKYSKIL